MIASDVSLRPAREGDMTDVRAIYNHYVLTSTCTFQMEPETSIERQRWYEAHGPSHPILVAETKDRIVGWASLTRFNPRCGYASTVESSVYVHHEAHRKGIGRALMTDLVGRAASLGYHAIIAGIASDQSASIGLHERLGFTQVARLREVGKKFGLWLDVLYLQKMLA
ncbi:MAG: N-acetyltransferase [Polyangiaceae bacterium]|nr:N-acetyltransferase [Polyangiaceae bacterium]